MVQTENEPDAGTTANVYVTLYGSNGDSGRRLLQSKDSVASFTKPGQVSYLIIIRLWDLTYANSRV